MAKLKIGRMEADENVRIYFSKQVLTNHPMAGEPGIPSNNSFLDAVLDIPGVDLAEVHRYHIKVLKSPMWNWSEIEPCMLRLLAAFNLGEGCLASPNSRTSPDEPGTKHSD
ncbi:MAG: hypothetical protein ACTSPX_01195 [Candidatus Thorarchaeota archaeon]